MAQRPSPEHSSPPAGGSESDRTESGQAIRFSAWNLLLLIPLAMLITSLYNRATPELFGIPFFYWSQLAFVFVGVACVAVVYAKTKHVRAPKNPPRSAGPTVPFDEQGETR